MECSGKGNKFFGEEKEGETMSDLNKIVSVGTHYEYEMARAWREQVMEIRKRKVKD